MNPNPDATQLSAAQAAARLDVKLETLYAYVARGLVSRRRTVEGSWFDPLEIEGFARSRQARGRRTPALVGHGSGSPLLVLDTDIALIEDDRLYFRGREAAALAREQGFEAVAGWLWGGDLGEHARFVADIASIGAAVAVVAAMPPPASLLQRIQAGVVALAAADPFGAESSVETLARVGSAAIAGTAAALGADGDTVAAGLARAWAPEVGPEVTARIDEALVLLIDHDLAVSTLSARAAASARASGYAIISSGLGALDSALHGNASQDAVRAIRRVVDGESAEAVLGESVIAGRGMPGFGHRLYRGIDPRAAALLDALRATPGTTETIAAVDRLETVARERAGRHANVDLALGAMVTSFGLPIDAGTAIFALARMAGWIAHAMDEYGRPELRLRPEGRYTGL